MGSKLSNCKTIRKSTAQAIEVLESRLLMSHTWYVSPNGNDGAAGSAKAPQTLQYAIDHAKAGDTVALLNGTYNGGIHINTPHLTLTSAKGQHASIVAPTDDSNIPAAIDISQDASYTKIANLDVAGGNYYAIKTESTWDSGDSNPHGPSHVTITNNKIHDSGQDVIKLTPATNYATITKNEIYNSGRRYADNAEGIDAVQANNALVSGNNIHDITTNGLYFKGGSRNDIIQNNRLNNIGYSGILLGQSSDENWFDTKSDPNYYENINGTVRNNVITNTQGAGIGAWAAQNAKIYNNKLVNVAQSMFSGLLIQGQEHWTPNDVIVPSNNVSMYNNSVEVDSGRPVMQIRDNGLTGKLNLSNNHYKTNGSTPTFSDERIGFSGDIAAWKKLGRDAKSAAVA